MTDAERLQLQDWLRLKPEERQVAIDLARELATPGRMAALRRILDAEAKLMGIVQGVDSFKLVRDAFLKAAALITAAGVIALGWERLIGKG